MGSPRSDATEIWNAGVDAVRAKPLVGREVSIEGSNLLIGQRQWPRKDFDRVIIVGAGKAATAMAQGLLEAINNWLPVVGWINVPEGTVPEAGSQELGDVHVHAARPAGVNEPTAEGVAGTREILQLVSDAGERDLCIALISGGGSALLPAPVDGITLEDKQNVTRFLSGAGADITELNTVRKHLSAVKGGGLLRACRAGELVTLILSDVLGDPLDLIASGPTVPDTSTIADAIDVLRKYDPQKSLGDRIYATLSRQQTATATPQHQVCKSTTLVIGNNAVAVDEAGIRAEKLGYNHAMQSARQCESSAEDVGRRLAEMTVGMLRADPNAHRTDCLITGGEPTVTLAPANVRGRGGRNQQLVLAAYQHLLSLELTDDEWNRLCILSGGTDGEDGPTDAAGAILDAEVHHRATGLGLDVANHLNRNDSYQFFNRTNGLLITGPTGTNVCDVRVAVVKAP
jgi:glycerate-2-kinase